MFTPPPKVRVFTLPHQEAGSKDFGRKPTDISWAINFLNNQIWDRSGKRPNHFWLNERDWMRLSQDREVFKAIYKIQKIKLCPYRGLIGIHAAYLRPGIEAPNTWVGAPHADLISCPEYYAIVVPKYYSLFENAWPEVRQLSEVA